MNIQHTVPLADGVGSAYVECNTKQHFAPKPVNQA